MATILTWDGQTDYGSNFGNVPPEILETAYVYFKLGDALIDVTTPTGKVLNSAGVLVALKTLATETVVGSKIYNLTRLSQGSYKISFYSNSMVHGLYDLIFSGVGTDAAYNPLTVTGQFLVGFASRTQDLIWRVRHQLEDYDPQFYTLISTASNAWSDESLLMYLQSALNDFNYYPSIITNYSLENIPMYTYVIDGAVIRALQAMAVRENWNTMSYADEWSLAVNRAPFFKELAAQIQAQLNFKLNVLKYQLALYGDGVGVDGAGAVGMAEQSLPFQISRILSWLPNMKNTFGL